ncbi:hypothetical protein FPSE_01349 [Fusarium pseudograminearum CS3096]|uniref:Uncharacterized protein n=1 Tax=Fusarium pseudograminearum (strain CS3096) TaxID=1028729 RepID=K3V012_FUSPC|nr:hypothetical protein FPSE_01349 [Fusarium pseudograminearum CS3096]EKJ78461.1 hypothetical protein FPSE_01349 [Fusarium pseudograminearum CS3096]
MNSPAYTVPVDRKRNPSPFSRLSSGESEIHSFIFKQGFMQQVHLSNNEDGRTFWWSFRRRCG